MKTIVFAYSEFGCVGIEELLAAGYDIVAVFTYRDDPNETVFWRSVAELCAKHNIPAYLDSDTIVEQAKTIAPDYVFSFYWRSLLPDDILTLPRKGAFNLHGSLLPKYRGRAPVNWVLVKGEKETGVTLHYMVAKADAGDIVAQAKVAIDYDDTAFTLQRKLVEAARTLLKKQLPLIANGKAARIRQDMSQGFYCGRRTPADGLIDWKQPAETVRNLIRAVTKPYPGAFTYANGKKLLIWESAVDAKQRGTPGCVLSISPLIVACGDGALIVKTSQGEEGLVLKPGMQLHSLAPLGERVG